MSLLTSFTRQIKCITLSLIQNKINKLSNQPNIIHGIICVFQNSQALLSHGRRNDADLCAFFNHDSNRVSVEFGVTLDGDTLTVIGHGRMMGGVSACECKVLEARW
jgi:hypothetical protein